MLVGRKRGEVYTNNLNMKLFNNGFSIAATIRAVRPDLLPDFGDNGTQISALPPPGFFEGMSILLN